MTDTAAVEAPAAAPIRRTSGERLLQVFLLVTFYAAYLSPILRPSAGNPTTLFRLLFPIAAALVIGRFFFQPRTVRVALFLAVVFAYSLTQMLVAGGLRDPVMTTYLTNVLILIAFIFVVDVYVERYGADHFYRHLYGWFAIMVLLSLHQLATRVNYPIVPNDTRDYARVARIFFGQENEASIAIAAFIPFLIFRGTRTWTSMALLLAALFVLYMNNTRVVLIAVAAYFVIRLAARIFSAVRLPVKWSLALPLVALAIGVTAFAMRDVPIALSDHKSTLQEMVFEPIGEILSGTQRRDVDTSINVRVTLIVGAMRDYIESAGFGIGPGASTYIVARYYPRDFVTSMHSFPIQTLVEYGWLLIGMLVWLFVRYRKHLDWSTFFPYLFFIALATSSATSGLVTNYYTFACLVFATHFFASGTDAERLRNVPRKKRTAAIVTP